MIINPEREILTFNREIPGKFPASKLLLCAWGGTV
jgi:hypothetical protein